MRQERKKRRPISTKVRYSRNAEGTIMSSWIKKAIEMMNEGAPTESIRSLIYEQKEGSRSKSIIDLIIADATKHVAVQYSKSRTHITKLHIRRYNQAIKRLMNKSYTHMEEGWRRKEAEINDLMNCLETIYQKEKLLQFHNKYFKFEINNETEFNIKPDYLNKDEFDISKLPFEEQVELLNLLQIARRTDMEIQSITAAKPEEIKIEDAQSEIIEDDNIKMIQLTKEKKEEPTTAIALSNTTERLKEALRRKAAAEYQQKGGNVDKNELH